MLFGSLAVLLVLSFPIFVRLWFDFLHYGDGWRQGDWLINFGSGAVRRGIIGEALIWISDTSGLTLLKTTILLQASLWTTLLGLFWIVWLQHSHTNLVILLAASPMIFLLAWAGDPQGIMRKEILGYLAFACLILCSIRSTPSLLLASLAVAFFILGCIGNILHLFLTPAFLVGLYLLKIQDKLGRFSWLALSLTSVGMALFWVGFAQAYREIPNITGACEALLQRGMGQAVCDHAIRWLVAGDVDHGAQVAMRVTMVQVAQFGAIATLGVVPLILTAYYFNLKRPVALIALICFAPMLPLYVMATDWGRWFSISYTVAACLILQMQAMAPVPKVRRPSEATLALLLALSLLMTPSHGIGWQAGGVVQSLWKTVTDVT